MLKTIDFNNPEDLRNVHIREQIKRFGEHISQTGLKISMRRLCKELNIPQTTMRRYMLDYTVLLENCYPDYYDNGKKVNYNNLRRKTMKILAMSRVSYQTAGIQRVRKQKVNKPND